MAILSQTVTQWLITYGPMDNKQVFIRGPHAHNSFESVQSTTVYLAKVVVFWGWPHQKLQNDKLDHVGEARVGHWVITWPETDQPLLNCQLLWQHLVTFLQTVKTKLPQLNDKKVLSGFKMMRQVQTPKSTSPMGFS